MWSWVQNNETLIGWLIGVSVVMFVGSLIALPIVVARIPADYFTHRRKLLARWRDTHPVLRIAMLIAKNVIGAIMILAGMAMLILPGQGILAILVGLILVDIPGRRKLELWVAQRQHVRKALNWLRRKVDQPPLNIPDHPRGGES